MIELLKKIGMPATVAAVIATIITLLPFIFKLDERYAKAEALEQQAEQLNAQITDLSIEVGRLAGTQQVLIAVLAAKNTMDDEADPPEASAGEPTRAAHLPLPVAPQAASSAPPPIAAISTEPPRNREEVTDRLKQAQQEVQISQERAKLTQERSETYKK